MSSDPGRDLAWAWLHELAHQRERLTDLARLREMSACWQEILPRLGHLLVQPVLSVVPPKTQRLVFGLHRRRVPLRNVRGCSLCSMGIDVASVRERA